MYKGNKKQKQKYYLCVMIFFLLFLLARLCVFINAYLFGFQGDLIYLVGYPTWFWLQLGYNILSHGGLFVIYYAIESELLNTKYFFSILTIYNAILSIINAVVLTDLTFVLVPSFAVIMLGLPILYLYIGIKSSDQARTNAYLFSIGILLIELGIILALPEARVALWPLFLPLWVPIYFGPIFHILGGVILIKGIWGVLQSISN